MRNLALASALASTILGCSDGPSRHAPPDTAIDDKPAALTNQPHVRITFHASGIANRFSCQLDGGAPTPCIAPFEADVSDGDHSFEVSAALNAEVDDTPATTSWTVDTVPPETTLAAAPPPLDNSLAPEIAFQGTDNRGAVTFECALDDGAFAPCASPVTVAVVDGNHRYSVRAVDAAGNRDPSPATASWVVDSTAPDTMISAGPAPGATTAEDVSFAFGSPDSPVTFECKLDPGAFAACTSPVSFTLGDGLHTFTVRARDVAGVVDPSPAVRTWTVDATAPDVAITQAPANPSNSATAVFGFSSTDATATFTCKIDSSAFAPCTPGFTSPSLADGGHTFTVRATDPVGHASTAAVTWTIDTVAPTVNVTQVASPTRVNRPNITFTVAGATSIQCQIDTGAFASCSSPFTPPSALADSSHTITVRGTDAAHNSGTGSTTFTVDTTPPGVAFDDAPPAQWPVNYFDMRFHTTDASATLTCSLNGAAFSACASPLAVTTTYNVSSTFSVRARDPAGNIATISTSWTSSNGLVLHYPWEQGQTHNTSLLAQDGAYSPDGTAVLPIVGGWAGTAAGSPAAHTYKNTIRALSSSAGGGYTASIWVRVASSANGGTVLSTLTPTNGFQLDVSARQVALRVNEGGKAFTVNAALLPNQWVQLGVLTSGPGSGLQLLVNGSVVGTAAAPSVTGFGAGQAPDLTVGSVFDVDLDDLRFYNRALATGEFCSTLVRGQLDAAGLCVPLIPGFELDFENNQVRDTGRWGLGFSPPSPAVVSFVGTKLGSGLRLTSSDQSFGITSGFANQINQAPGHSFSFWFVAGAATQDTMIDFLRPCAAGAPLQCGIRVTYSTAGGLTIIAGPNSATTISKTIAIPNGVHSVVVTEQKVGANGTTQSLTVYVDGVATVIPIGIGNVYANPSDTVLLPRLSGTTIDEYEVWPRDLSLDPEMLCENGLDGEWNAATGVCLLTSN